jgi:hypothetical protein
MTPIWRISPDGRVTESPAWSGKSKNHRSVARLAFPILDVPDPAELKKAI